MRKLKPSHMTTPRGETSKKEIRGERYNVESGSGHVKTLSNKIPKTPAEKVDLDE